MKALVLSGGMGSRLRPLTDHMPEQLIPRAKKPVLIHCLERIREAGIREVGLMVGDRGTEIGSVVGNGRAPGLDVTCIHQKSPAGLAHGVRIARDLLGDDGFVMFPGDDVVLGGQITDAVQWLIDSGRRVRASLHTGFWQDTEDCFAGPYTAMGDRATLRRAGIERSIALDGAELIDAGDVQDSLIGPEVTTTEETSGAPGSGPTAADGARAVVGI